MAGPAIMLGSLDELQDVVVSRMKGDDIVVLFQLADGFQFAICWIPGILVVQDHRLPHKRFEFRHRMLVVDDRVMVVDGKFRIGFREETREIVGVGKDFEYRVFDGANLPACAQLIAKNIPQNAEALVLNFLFAHRRQLVIASLENRRRGSLIVRLVNRQKDIVAVPGQVSPTRGALLIHGEHVAIHPEKIQRQLAAQLVFASEFSGLQAAQDFIFGQRFLAKIPSNYSTKLAEVVKYGEIELRKKIAGKNNPIMSIEHERL